MEPIRAQVLHRTYRNLLEIILMRMVFYVMIDLQVIYEKSMIKHVQMLVKLNKHIMFYVLQ